MAPKPKFIVLRWAFTLQTPGAYPKSLTAKLDFNFEYAGAGGRRPARRPVQTARCFQSFAEWQLSLCAT